MYSSKLYYTLDCEGSYLLESFINVVIWARSALRAAHRPRETHCLRNHLRSLIVQPGCCRRCCFSVLAVCCSCLNSTYRRPTPTERYTESAAHNISNVRSICPNTLTASCDILLYRRSVVRKVMLCSAMHQQRAVLLHPDVFSQEDTTTTTNSNQCRNSATAVLQQCCARQQTPTHDEQPTTQTAVRRCLLCVERALK